MIIDLRVNGLLRFMMNEWIILPHIIRFIMKKAPNAELPTRSTDTPTAEQHEIGRLLSIMHRDREDVFEEEGGLLYIDDLQMPEEINLFEAEANRNLDDCNKDETSQYYIPSEHSEHIPSEQDLSLNPPIIANEKTQQTLEKKKHKGKVQINMEKSQNFYQKFKKNVNMPKAIGRYLMDHYHLFKGTLFAHEPTYFGQLARELEERKIWVRRSKKNSIKLKDLKYYFGQGIRLRRHSCLNRLMMRKIIQKRSRDEIIPNNQVKGKLEYLVATKVYALRCGNSVLATRMQMR